MAKRKTAPEATGVRREPGAPPASSPPPDLKPEHKKFARLFARHGNQTACYLKVYPNSSYDAARNSASELLAKPCVQDYVACVREKDRLSADFSRQDALRILVSIAARGKDKDRATAIESLWEKLGLGEAVGEANWFDGFERIAELVSGSKRKE